MMEKVKNGSFVLPCWLCGNMGQIFCDDCESVAACDILHLSLHQQQKYCRPWRVRRNQQAGRRDLKKSKLLSPRLNQVLTESRVKKLIFSIKRLICLTLVSRFCFIKSQSQIIKPLVIKLIVEVKVVPNLNRA